MKRGGNSLVWPELGNYTIPVTIAAGMSGQVPRAVECGFRLGDVNVGLFGASEWVGWREASQSSARLQTTQRGESAKRRGNSASLMVRLTMQPEPL